MMCYSKYNLTHSEVKCGDVSVRRMKSHPWIGNAGTDLSSLGHTERRGCDTGDSDSVTWTQRCRRRAKECVRRQKSRLSFHFLPFADEQLGSGVPSRRSSSSWLLVAANFRHLNGFLQRLKFKMTVAASSSRYSLLSGRRRTNIDLWSHQLTHRVCGKNAGTASGRACARGLDSNPEPSH